MGACDNLVFTTLIALIRAPIGVGFERMGVQMSETRNIVDQYPMEQMIAGTPQTSVYRSTDPASGESVAVKMISALGSGTAQVVRQHFLRSMGAVQFLQLPAFPEILDFGFTEEDAAFMVMRWVDATPIAKLQGEPPARILPLFAQMVEALEALAMGQVHHLNLSPENLLIRDGDDGESIVILGFGTSIYLTGAQAGAMMGHSPESDTYMAPERLDPQTEGEADGNLADLYSISLILVELLGGSLSVDGSGNRVVEFSEEARSSTPGLAMLAQLLSSALMLDPKEREVSYPIFGKMLRDLIANITMDEAQAGTSILSPAELRAAADAARADVESDFQTRIIAPEEHQPDALELGGEAFELDLPEEDSPALPSEELTAELPVPKGDGLSSGEDAPTLALPKADPDAANFEIAETAPTPKTPASQTEETPDLDETDPGIFDPNETNPAIDPEALGAGPPPSTEEFTPPPISTAPTPPPVPKPPVSPAPPPTPAVPSTPPPPVPASKVAPTPPPQASGAVSPPPPQASGATPPPPRSKARAAGVSGAGFQRKWLYLAAVVLVLFLIVIGIVAMRSCRKPPEVKPAVVVEMAPTPTPVKSVEDGEGRMHPLLLQSGALLESGDVEGARKLIKQLKPEEISAFSQAEKDDYESILQAVRGSRLDAAISDLEGGLKHGSIPMLKRSLAAFSHLDSGEYRDRRGLRTKIGRAREILKLHAALWKAHQSSDNSRTLELAAKMIKLLPDYSGSYTFRGEAAKALESASETALSQRNFRLASQILAPLENYYPSRKGLKSRLDAIRVAELKYQQQKGKLEEARAKGAAGDPQAGLEILKSLKLDSSLKAQAAELEKSLKAQLVEMDRNPPQISPVEGEKFAFKKKKSITLKFKITDDMGVENATILLEFKGAAGFIRKSLKRDSRGLYVITITPAMHDNEDFKFYVEARDASDHVGRFGSAQVPKKVRRLKGLKALFG